MVGTHVHRVRQSDVFETVLSVLTQYDARRVGVGVSEDETIGNRLSSAGIEVVDWHHSGGFDSQFDLDAGITGVHAAISETGTLVCHSGPDQGRGLSLVPPVHVAIVRSSDILPDMIDYWALFKDKSNLDLPSSISFITGPSKTADIEGVLIKGVHGPLEVHVVLVEE
jgi:L-lactate dehydrogenase complex protein LldG